MHFCVLIHKRTLTLCKEQADWHVAYTDWHVAHMGIQHTDAEHTLQTGTHKWVLRKPQTQWHVAHMGIQHTGAEHTLQTGTHKWVLSKPQTGMHTRMLKTYCRPACTNGC